MSEPIAQANKQRYLTFYLATEEYGISIHHIKEIIAMMKITSVPKIPSYMKGVINLRGSIIPIVDTRARFGMSTHVADMHTAIIIVEVEHTSIGFIVDRVEEVSTIDNENLTNAPKFGNSAIDADFISQVARIQERVVMVLDVEKLVHEDALADIEGLNAQTTQGE
jgi:purine-binding chemotaxis protein CheW